MIDLAIAVAFLVGFFLGQFGVRKLIQNLVHGEQDDYRTTDLVINSAVVLLGLGLYCWSSYNLPSIIPMRYPVVATLPLWSCGALGVMFCLRHVERNKNDENIEAFKVMGYSIALLLVGLIGTCVETGRAICPNFFIALELIILGLFISLGLIVGGLFLPSLCKDTEVSISNDMGPWYNQGGP